MVNGTNDRSMVNARLPERVKISVRLKLYMIRAKKLIKIIFTNKLVFTKILL